VIVPTLVKLEFTTLLASVVPDNVPAFAVPDKVPVSVVASKLVKPVTEVTVPPNVMVVEPKIVVLFANCPFVIPAFAAISPLTIVASAIFADVIEPSLTPAEATRVST
jgi:hypothetical protein